MGSLRLCDVNYLIRFISGSLNGRNGWLMLQFYWLVFKKLLAKFDKAEPNLKIDIFLNSLKSDN